MFAWQLGPSTRFGIRLSAAFPGIAILAVATPLAISALAPGRSASAVSQPSLVELRAGTFAHRASGEFTRDGRPVSAPMVNFRISRSLSIMRRQVSVAEYQRCVDAEACPPVGQDTALADRPVTKVNWKDANLYAAWLSRQTGMSFRLPTDEEWAYAAAGRLDDDAVPDSTLNGDPGRRSLANYALDETGAADIDKVPQPIGSFGANENGLLDIAGNVWEWTQSCYVRIVLGAQGDVAAKTVNCGIRIAEGRHRAYMIDFIRDPRGGGCSGGTPPSNLGFRLVRDDDRWRRLRSVLANFVPSVVVQKFSSLSPRSRSS
jgi:formylglycine-generating enzyme required for sulfatase activity